MAKVLIISGEPSGDLYASGLIKSLKSHNGAVDFFAVGGENSGSAGAELIADIAGLSVMGFTEVVCKLKAIRKILNRVSGWITANKPDAVILVDFPSFNFKIAKLSNRLKIPVIYFIPPKIWASRYKRINFIKRYVKFVIVIFPFELDIYRNAGIEAYYFGNPLYGLFGKEQKEAETGGIKNYLSGRHPVVSFLPGSRKAELKYHADRIARSLILIKASHKNAFFIFPFRKGIDFSYFLSVIEDKNIPKEWYAVTDSVRDALHYCDIAVVASGTASLEACFYNKPVIIVYYLNYLTYILAKILVKVKYIGLINILANDLIVPELIESKFTPENIYEEIDKFLKDDIYKKSVLDKISGAVSTLKTGDDPFEASAGIIYDKILKNIAI